MAAEHERRKTPWLLRAGPVGRCGSASVFRRESTLRQFGSLARLETLPSDFEARLDAVESGLDDDLLRESWRRHLAREVLLATRLGRGWASAVVDRFAETSVFAPGEARLADLVGWSFSVAAFPIAKGEEVDFGILWLFEDESGTLGPDHRDQFEAIGAGIAADGRRTIYLVSSDEAATGSVIGDSWQLAAALAERVLARPEETVGFAALAFDWIATGAMDGARVRRIGHLLAKLRLATRRSWIVPAENRDELASGPVGSIRAWYAGDLDSAWAHVIGTGAVDGGEVDWPDDVEVMHSFVSGAWQPLVSCALFCRPRRVVLWHSDNRVVSTDPAEQIELLLRERLFPGTEEIAVERRRVPSDNLAEAERVISPELRRDLRSGRTVIFNVTQGNRLMSYAALGLAQRHPNLSLVYRDLDAPKGVFTLIRYDGTQPTTQQVRPPDPLSRGDVDWDRLISVPPLRPGPDWREMWRQIAVGTEEESEP